MSVFRLHEVRDRQNSISAISVVESTTETSHLMCEVEVPSLPGRTFVEPRLPHPIPAVVGVGIEEVLREYAEDFCQNELGRRAAYQLLDRLEVGIPEDADRQVAQLSWVYLQNRPTGLSDDSPGCWGVDDEEKCNGSAPGPTTHYSECLSQMRQALGQRLSAYQLTVLAVGVGYGPTPTLTPSQRESAMTHAPKGGAWIHPWEARNIIEEAIS